MSAQEELDKAKAALADPKTRSYTYKGKRYTLTQLRDDLIPQLETAAKSEAKATATAAGVIKYNEQQIKLAEDAVQRATQARNGIRTKFNQGRATETELNAAEQKLQAAETTLSQLIRPAAPTPPVSTTNVAGPTVLMGRRGAVTRPALTEPPAPVVEAPAATTDSTTTITSTTGPAATGKKKKKAAAAGTGPMGISDAVRKEIRTLFPQFASSFDGGQNEQQFVDFFGGDLITVLVKAASEDAYGQLETDAEVAAFKRDIENTVYGQRTSEAEQAFDFSPGKQAELIRVKKNEITKQYADLQLNTEQLDAVARDAARKGWTGDDLKFGVYSYAYGAKPTTAMQSELADRIRNAGRAYGYVVSDAELKAALTNTPYNGMMVTEDSILQKAQRTAKGQYGHLADQIDAGVSLEDIFYNYKAYAARTLGLDPSEIDFVNDPKWAEAFGSKEQGQLSLNDWLVKIKSDERYGWQFTSEAKQKATDLVMSFEKAFGYRT